MDEISAVVSVSSEKPEQTSETLSSLLPVEDLMGGRLSYCCVIVHRTKNIYSFYHLLARMLISAQNVRFGWNIRDHFR